MPAPTMNGASGQAELERQDARHGSDQLSTRQPTGVQCGEQPLLSAGQVRRLQQHVVAGQDGANSGLAG